MQIGALPLPATQAGPYDGADTAGFIASRLDAYSEYTGLGVKRDELQHELVDAFVFWQFIAGVSGQYTVNGSAFAQNWRLMPHAASMARALNAPVLAQKLEEAWEEVQSFDPKHLDLFDPSRLLSDADPQVVEVMNAQTDIYVSVPDAQLKRMQHLLDIAWNDLVGEAPQGPAEAGDSNLPLENALAHYVQDRITFNILPDPAACHQAKIAIIDGLDDYPARMDDIDTLPNVRALLMKAGLRYLGFSYVNITHFQTDPVHMYRVRATKGDMIVAEYRAHAQLIDQETWKELAVTPLIPLGANTPSRDHIWDYDTYPDWHLTTQMRPTPTRFPKINPFAQRGPKRKGTLQ